MSLTYPNDVIRAIKHLAEEAQKQRLVVFVGAGCSIASGLPSWSELLHEIMKENNISANNPDMLKLALFLEKKIGKLIFREKVCNSLKKKLSDDSPLVTALAELPTNLFITTNYDHLLEDQLRKKFRDLRVIRNDVDLPSIDSTQKTLIKLHGDVDSPSSLIITSEDYRNYGEKFKNFQQYLLDNTKHKTMLLLGTSFNDPRLIEASDMVIRAYGEFSRPAYIVLSSNALMPEETAEDYQLKLETAKTDYEIFVSDLENRNIKVINLGHYEDLPAVLQKIKEQFNKSQNKEPNIFLKNSLEGDYTTLRNELRSAIDNQIQNLYIAKLTYDENEPVPLPDETFNKARELISFLHENKDKASGKLLIKALGISIDKCLNTYSEDNIECRELVEATLDWMSKEVRKLSDETIRKEFKAKIVKLNAKKALMEDKPEVTLSLLEELEDDSYSTIRLRLTALLQYKDYERAEKLVEKLKNKDSLSDLIILIYAANGKFIEARKIVQQHEKSGEMKYSELKLAFAKGIYNNVFDSLPSYTNELRYLRPISDEQSSLLEEAWSTLEPLTLKNPTKSFFNYQVCVLLVSIGSILARWHKSFNYAAKLLEYNLINHDSSIVIAQVSSLPSKTPVNKKTLEKFCLIVREKYSQYSWAVSAAAQVMLSQLNEGSEAYSLVKDLLLNTAEEKEKWELSLLLLEISGIQKKSHETLEIIKDLWGELHPVTITAKAGMHVKSGNLNEAERALENLKIEEHDPLKEAYFFIAASIRAQLEMRRNNYEKAVEILQGVEEAENKFESKHLFLLLEAATRTDNPDLELILRTSEKIRARGIADCNTEFIRAQALFQLKRFDEAFEISNQLPPKKEYVLLQARCLALQNETEKSLNLLKPYCNDDENLLLDALQLYLKLVNPEQAWHKAKELFDRYKDSPHLLSQYLTLACQTNNEAEVPKALNRMDQLREEGKIPAQLFQKFTSINPLLDLIKEQAQHEKKLLELYASEQMPIEVLVIFRRWPMYLDWAFRTQETLNSIANKNSRKFETLCTNSMYLSSKSPAEIPSYKAIKLGDNFLSLVFSYNALITLHQLGFMPLIEKHIEKAIIPQTLLHCIKAEAKEFLPHQLSEYKAIEGAVQELLTGRVGKAKTEHITDSNFSPVESAHQNAIFLASEKKGAYLSITISKESANKLKPFDAKIVDYKDLVKWLYKRNLIPRKIYDAVQPYQFANLPQKTDIKDLEKIDTIVTDDLTLRQLIKDNLLKPILSKAHMSVLLTEDDALHLNREYNQLKTKDYVKDLHKSLSDWIEKPGFFHVKSPQDPMVSNKFAHKDNYQLLQSVIDGMVITNELKNSVLISDDRWTQSNSNVSAIGTIHLIDYLKRTDKITGKQKAEAYLQMVKWRYMFLLIPTDVYLHFCKINKENLPGPELRELALYQQNCLNSNCFSHLVKIYENTPIPPVSAVLYQRIIQTLIHLLVEVWSNLNEFTLEQAKLISAWILDDAIPLPPKTLDEDARSKLYDYSLNDGLETKLFAQMLDNEPCPRVNAMIEYFFKKLYGQQWRNKKFEAFIKFGESLTESSVLNTTTKERKNILRYLLSQIIEQNENGIFKLPTCYKTKIVSLTGVELIPNNMLKEKPSSASELKKRLKANKSQVSTLFQRSPKEDFVPLVRHENTSYILFPHVEILAPEISVRQNAIAKLRLPVSQKQNISDQSMKLLNSLEAKILDPDNLDWLVSSKQLNIALLKDYCYLNALIKLLPNFEKTQIDYSLEEEINKTINGLLNPDLQTVIDSLPKPLEAGFTKHTTTLCTEIWRKVQKESNLLEKYIEESGMVLCKPFNDKFVEYSKTDAIELADSIFIELTSAEKDPVTILLGLESLFTLRSCLDTGFDDQKYFGDEFDKLLMALQAVEDAEEPDSQAKTIWNLIKSGSRYYLLMLDIYGKDHMPESERRFATALWMGWLLYKSCFKFWGKIGASKTTINNNALNLAANIELRTQPLFLQYYYKGTVACPLRKLLFYKSNKLLTREIAGLFIDKENNKIVCKKAFCGTLKILHKKIRDKLMEDGVFDALFNISESPIQNHTLTWKFLWPLHLTLPPFIRAYYGDSFDYIGKKAVEQISLMETMPSNFKQKLEKAPSELLQTVDPSPNIIMIISDSQNTILNGGSYNKVLSSWLNKPPLRTLLKQKLDAQENIKLNFVKFMSDCVPLLCANKRYEDSGLLADFLLSINLNSTTNAVWELGLSLCSAQLFGLENNYLSIFINKYGGSKSVKSTFRDFLSTMKSIKTAMPLEIRDRMTELFGQLADFEK